MRKSSPLLLGVLCGLAALPLAASAQSHPDWSTPVPANVKVPAHVARAIDDAARAADRKDDVRRQLAAVMVFTGAKPGDKILELAPGKGYWTRVFSQVVKPGGHVYQLWPKEWAKFDAKGFDAWRKLSATPHYADVTPLQQSLWDIKLPQQVDIVFTCQNYHDFHDPFSGHVDMHAFNESILKALKPGGVFIVIDNMAPAGSGTSDTDTLHRIDPAAVKKEIESVGFVFDGSSDALLNPKDPLTIKVFDKAIQGHESQFIYRFRKPAG